VTPSHLELHEALGAYVLGHLDDDLRRSVEDHLATCETCRAEVAELGSLAEALRGVDRTWEDDPGVVTTPAALDERIRRLVREPSRRRRWLPAGIAVAVAAAAAVAATVVVTRDEPPTVIAVPGVRVADGITATAGLVNHTWGVEIRLRTTGLRAGERFEVWVLGEDGASYDAGEILGVAGATITCGMSSSVPLDDAESFRVVDAGGAEVIAAAVPHPS
jgi:anti-sigma-K factor RskA